MTLTLYNQATCNKCGGTYDRDAFFRVREPNAFGSPGMQRHATCIGCELTARTAAKEDSRHLVKAQSTRMRHAAKFAAKLGQGRLTGEDFGDLFGWDLERMVADIKAAEHGTCCYCYRLFSEMPNALSDITIDIVDPQKKPYYKTNTRWCCSTCNSEKSHTAPELWERKLQSWRIWNARQSMAPEDRGLLF